MGIIHGAKTYVIQIEDGQIEEPYSISAGLDYPGIGPMHANLAKQKRAIILPVNDDEAIQAAYELTQLEGIIPALESAHALGALPKMKFKPTDVVVLTVSGRGDKDSDTYLKANNPEFITNHYNYVSLHYSLSHFDWRPSYTGQHLPEGARPLYPERLDGEL